MAKRRSGGNIQPMFDPYKAAEECDGRLPRPNIGESYAQLMELRAELARTEGDLAVAVHEATRLRAAFQDFAAWPDGSCIAVERIRAAGAPQPEETQ